MLGSPSVSKQYLGYCSPVSGRTRRASQKMDESWVLMRGQQNDIPKPSFHPLLAHYAAVNPFLKSLTCRWCLLGFRLVVLSDFSRNRRKQQSIAGSKFALFYQKNPPYSGRKKTCWCFSPAWPLLPPRVLCPRSTAPHGLRSALAPEHPHSSSTPSSFPLDWKPSTLLFSGEMSDAGYQEKWGLLRAGG